MADGARTTRFQARVALERRFLTPVNARFGHHAPLAGLTAKAIESWNARAAERFDSEVVLSIAEVLTEASRRAKLLVDDSREVFDPALREPSGMDELVDLLKFRIAGCGAVE